MTVGDGADYGAVVVASDREGRDGVNPSTTHLRVSA
jgi:hypothetical protein